MVDIHSHILPGLDDGAQTMEESMEMLAIAAASGTTDIVATPHSNGEFRFDSDRVEELLQELSDRNNASIAVHWGCDFHLNYDNLHNFVDNPTKYTINHRQYLMVELPDIVALTAVKQAIDQLIEIGIIPVITHPERNRSLQPQLGELERWVRKGARVQVTAQSLLGRFGSLAQHAANSLLSANLVHFIASDAHDCVDRTPDLSGAYEYVSGRYGAHCADAVFVRNPAAALRGDVLTDSPSTLNKKSIWRLFR
jgi:protein-tyrosine phosphatase